MKYKNLILTIISVLLLILFVCTQINTNKKDSRKKITTALLNPKNVNEVTQIELSSAEGEIFLNKNGSYWTIKTSEKTEEIPAAAKSIDDLLTELSRIVNLYKVSELSKKNYSNFFPEANYFSLKYYWSDSNSTSLIFGKYDFSQNFRYLMTDKNTSIYEINPSLDKFLNTSFQVWAEPYLISQNIIGKIQADDIQRVIVNYPQENISKALTSSNSNIKEISTQFLELRHGGKLEQNDSIEKQNYELYLKIELGNKKDIELTFTPNNSNQENPNKENFYTVQVKFQYNQIFTYKISGWTYNKIKEMML